MLSLDMSAKTPGDLNLFKIYLNITNYLNINASQGEECF